MSSSIDQRIVEMQFNNQQFEAAVSQTMSSLDSLKNSLNVLGSAEALEDLADVDTSGIKSLSDEVDKSSSKFSALEEIAVGALRRIGEMAIEAGANLARNLGNTLIFDNITAGWQKYADKTEAVQTIMSATREELAAQGNQMEQVNEQLDKLNWFTDETSYNFVDMTSNIGKFTSVGVGLAEATDAMMGISTWAASSGANIEQASHAMYNLSQAMGVGAVTLADWKSIENANMATAEFKQVAMDAAVEAKTLIKTTDGVYKTIQGHEVNVQNFREYLTKDQWLTNEVLMDTLSQYGSYATKLSDAQEDLTINNKDYYGTTSKLLKDIDKYINGTLDIQQVSEETKLSTSKLIEIFDDLSKSEDDLGRRAFKAAQEATTFKQAIDSVKDAASTTWMNIFEDVFGDYEHAKVLWTDLSNALWDTFVGPLSNLEEVVGSWSEQGGNAFAIEGVINLWEAFSSVLGAVGEALGELFPPLTAEKLVDLTRAFRDFTAGLKPSEETLEKIKNVVLGVAEPFKFFFSIVKSIVSTVFPPLLSLGGKIISMFFNLASTVGGAVSNAFISAGEKVGKIFTALGNVKGVMFAQLSEPLKRISDTIKRIFDTIVKKVKGLDVFKKLGEKVTGFTDLLVKNISKWGFDKWKTGSFKSFGDMVATAFENAADAIEKYDLNGKVNSIVTYLGNAFKKLKGYFNQAKDYITNIDIVGKLTTAFEYIKNVYYQAKDSVKEYIDSHEGLKSVVDWFTSIKEKVQASIEDYGVLGTIVGAVGIAVDSIVNSLTSLYTYLKSSGVFTAIGNGFLAAYNSVVAFGTYIYDSLSPFVTAAYEDIKKFFEGFKGKSFTEIIDSFKKWKDSIKGPKDLLDSLKKTFSNLIKEIKEFFGKTKPEEDTPSTFEKIKESIKGVVDWLKELFANKNAVDLFKDVLSVIAAIAAIKFTFSISNLSNSLSGLLDIFKKQKKDSFGKVVIEIAVALAILAGSLWVLAQIPSDRIEDVSGTMVTLFGLLAGLGGLMMAMQKYFGSDMVKVGGGMLMLAGSIAIMLYVVKLISNSGITFETVKENIESFIVVFGSLGVLLLMTKLAGKNAQKGGQGVLLMSVALVIIVKTIKMIAKMDPNDVARGKRVVEEILAVFGVIMAFSWLSGKNANEAGKMFVKMAAAIAILSICMYAIGNMDPSTVKQGLKAIEELMGVMAIVMAFSRLSKGSGGSLFMIGVILAELTVALVILTYFDGDSVLNGAKSLSMVLLALGVSFALIGQAGPNISKALGISLSMVIVLSAIAGAMYILGQTAAEENKTNAIILSATMVVLVQVFKQFSKITATTKKMAKTAGLMVLVLAAIAGALWLLGQNDWTENLTNALALSAVLYVLVGVFKQLKGMNASLGQCAVAAGFLAVVLLEIVGALWVLGQFKSQNNLENALALSLVLLAVCGAIKILDTTNIDFMTALASVIAIGAILTEVTIALLVLSDMDPKANIENAAALSLLILALSASMFILSKADFLSQILGALGAVVGIGILLNGLAGVFAILGSWATDQRANIEGGIEIAKTVAHGLGEFVGNLITGVGDTVFGALPGYGENLSSFASNLEQFISVFSNAPDDIESKVEGITKAILMLVGAEFLQAIAGWFTGITGGHSMAEFGTQLSEFADSFVGFINKLNGVSITDATTAATGIIETMVALAGEIPNSGGLLGYIMGENDIDDFGGRLETFAEHFVAFANTIKDIPDVTSQSATVKAAAECMLAIANAIPNEGGVIAEFFGDNTLDTFGEHMADFAESFVKFAKKIKDMPESVKTDAATVQQASECMVALANQLPNTGGVIGWIVGENDLDDFGAKMETFAGHFVAFANTIKEIPSDITGKTESVEAAASILATFANTEIEKTGGLLQFFSGDSYQGLEDFGNGLKSLGIGLGGYYDQLKTIDLEAVEKSFNLFDAIINVANMAMNTETSSLYNIVDGMRAIGTSVLSGFTSVFTGTDEKGVAEGMINAALNIFFGNFNTALDTKKDLTVAFITDTLGPDLVAAFDKSMLTDDLEAIGTRVVEDIENGIITEQDPDAVGVVTDLGQALTDAINEILPEGVWFDVGLAAAQGLAEGIAAGTEAAVNAARTMASLVEEAASVSLQVNSPSKVFMRIGNSVVEGFVKGITDEQSFTANKASSTFAAISSYIANSIDDNLEFSPVITPVLDLTNLEKGSAAMDSMFGQRNLSGYAVAGPENVNIQDDAINRLVMGMDKFINTAQNTEPTQINIYVTGGNNADANEIADVVMDKLNVELHRRRAAMA